MATVSFTRMEDGTAKEYLYLRGVYMDFHKNVADEVLLMLGKLAGPTLGYKIDRYQHSLQSASRAQRDGADEETVIVNRCKYNLTLQDTALCRAVP